MRMALARMPRSPSPVALSIANGKLYIADTNNHAVRVADLVNNEVSTLELTGL